MARVAVNRPGYYPRHQNFQFHLQPTTAVRCSPRTRPSARRQATAGRARRSRRWTPRPGTFACSPTSSTLPAMAEPTHGTPLPRGRTTQAGCLPRRGHRRPDLV